ncbi:hypothetical protein B0J13DRAFT_279571 [Dactylonectria estremocensis]|uniref:Secreted protein n=1 Tax=Dactylonectria estremocensis TaxID=1079267 RepID=A0A9P9F168_9HYPO|nr:hypothetical protein B0J13DRAFT_279571 [Dactylonectria estremocensis]
MATAAIRAAAPWKLSLVTVAAIRPTSCRYLGWASGDARSCGGVVRVVLVWPNTSHSCRCETGVGTRSNGKIVRSRVGRNPNTGAQMRCFGHQQVAGLASSGCQSAGLDCMALSRQAAAKRHAEQLCSDNMTSQLGNSVHARH